MLYPVIIRCRLSGQVQVVQIQIHMIIPPVRMKVYQETAMTLGRTRRNVMIPLKLGTFIFVISAASVITAGLSTAVSAIASSLLPPGAACYYLRVSSAVPPLPPPLLMPSPSLLAVLCCYSATPPLPYCFPPSRSKSGINRRCHPQFERNFRSAGFVPVS